MHDRAASPVEHPTLLVGVRQLELGLGLTQAGRILHQAC